MVTIRLAPLHIAAPGAHSDCCVRNALIDRSCRSCPTSSWTMTRTMERDLKDLDTEELKDLLVQTAGLSREYIESQASSKGVTERYFCLFLLKPVSGDDARMAYELDDGD